MTPLNEIEALQAEINNLTSELQKKHELYAQLTGIHHPLSPAKSFQDNVLTSISHEIRTPMNGILGYCTLLLKNIEAPEHSRMISKIRDSAVRLLKTLDSLVLLSQLVRNKLNVNSETIPLENAITPVLKEFKSLAQQKGITLSLRILDHTVCAYADSSFLAEIVKALVDNAIKFTPEGMVIVEVDSLYKNEKLYARLSVIDTGMGISFNDREHIFLEFKQISEGISRTHEGLGAGLSVVKRMCDVLNAEINIESALDNGTTFTILFPGIINESIQKPIPVARPIIEKRPIIVADRLANVLLVDDNEINCEVTSLYLEGICSLVTAMNAEFGIRLANEQEFDCILLDINLGKGSSGIDILLELRKLDRYRNVPILAVTGYSLTSDRENLLEKGFNDYLAKPFEDTDLISLIERNIALNSRV